MGWGSLIYPIISNIKVQEKRERKLNHKKNKLKPLKAGSITNKTFFSGILSGIPNFNRFFYFFLFVKGQNWLRYRCFSTQNVAFRDFYEVDRSLYEGDRSLYEVGRSLYEVDRSLYEVDRSLYEVDRSLYEVDRSLYEVDRSFYEVDKKIEEIFVSTSYKLRSTSYKSRKKNGEEKLYHLTLPITKNMKKKTILT